MDASADEARDSGDQDVARPRMPSKRLDQKSILFKKLRPHKNERLGNRFTVSARRNKIDARLSNEENIQLNGQSWAGLRTAD